MTRLWDGDDLLSIGRQHLKVGQFEAAKQIGQILAKEDALAHRALALVGEALAAAGDPTAARAFYDCAIAKAVHGGHFDVLVDIRHRISELTPTQGNGSGNPDALKIDSANDQRRISAAEQTRNNLYRNIRNVLSKYGFEETLVELFDKVPPTENDLSWRKPDADERQSAAIARGVPPICINTLPKSGTIYLLNAFSRALDAPFVRISAGLFPSDRVVPSWAKWFSRGGCVSVQHMDGSAANLRMLREFGLDRIWAHVRDPRQAMLSIFHHMNSGTLLAAADAGADYYRGSLAERVEHHLDRFPRLVQWLTSWRLAAADPSHGMDILLTRQEDISEDPDAFFDRACAFFDVDCDLFTEEVIKPPRRGELHFRKGETDEWRMVFSASQQARLNDMLPDDLLQYFGWQR